LAIKPSVYLAGLYPNAPLRHRSENPEKLEDLLRRSGFTISNSALEADIFLALDYLKADNRALVQRKQKNKFNILFRSEPRCVIPDAFVESNLIQFDAVLSYGATKDITNRENWAQYWPNKLFAFDDLVPRAESAVLVNANKLSLTPSELYSLRRECINKLSFVRLYGEGWNLGLVAKLKTLAIEIRKNSVGNLFRYPVHGRLWFHHWPETVAPLDKLKTLSGFRYCLVIENDPNYMSEKLFDALFAGCIPIYVGPPISDYGIPDGLVIQAGASVSDIASAYEKAKAVNYEDYLRKLHAWLSSESTKRAHSSEEVLRRSIDFIELKYSEHLHQE